MDIILIAVTVYTCVVVLTTCLVCHFMMRHQAKSVKKKSGSEISEESEDVRRPEYFPFLRKGLRNRRVPDKIYVTRTGACFHQSTCHCLQGKVGVRAYKLCTSCFDAFET